MIRSRWALPPLTLRYKLLIMLTSITWLILLGQTLFWLSGEVTDLDARIAAHGTIQAQSLAASCTALLDGTEPRRFDSLLDRLGRTLDVLEVTVADAHGRVLAQRTASGKPVLHAARFEVFGAPRSPPGLFALLDRQLVYSASAPIARGTAVVGHVGLRFRSAEIAQKSTRLFAQALGMALFWMVAGGLLGSVYVRRITQPLARLTAAAQAVTDGRLDQAHLSGATGTDEIGLLESSFQQLLTALQAKQAENAVLLTRQHALNARLRQRVDEVTADLRETATYLQAVIRAMGEGVLTCDAHGEIVQANHAAVRHLDGFGRPAPGLRVDALVPDGGVLLGAVLEAVQSGKGGSLELVRTYRGGPEDDPAELEHRRTLLVRTYPLPGADHQPVGAVLMITDVTGERLSEARLRRHDRLISLGTIAAGLAHELGNYMHAIHGFASLLLRDTPAGDARRADVQAIRDENQRAVALLERFLQFARPGSVRFSPEPLAALVREALAMCAYQLRAAEVTVDEQIDPALGAVCCDARLLVQVLINLVLNAVDAMAGMQPREITVLGRRLGPDRVLLQVRDTGSGIAPEHVERIFDPFFTTKDAKGTGLGLSIAHQIVEVHGGTLTVTSAPGHGATFRIELPVAGPQKEPGMKQQEPGIRQEATA